MSEKEILSNLTTGNTQVVENLSDLINETIKRFLVATKGTKVTNLYDYILEEIEPALLETVMLYVRENQSEAAKILGLSRGTTRKKLKQYFGEKYCGTREEGDED